MKIKISNGITKYLFIKESKCIIVQIICFMGHLANFIMPIVPPVNDVAHRSLISQFCLITCGF